MFVFGATNQYEDLVNAYNATYGYNDLLNLQFAQQDYDRLKNASLAELGMTQAEKDMYLNQLEKEVLAQDKIARQKYGGLRKAQNGGENAEYYIPRLPVKEYDDTTQLHPLPAPFSMSVYIVWTKSHSLKSLIRTMSNIIQKS